MTTRSEFAEDGKWASNKYWEEGDKGYVVFFQNDKVTQTASGTKDEMKGKKKG
jgi:hypothetical protein